MTEEIDNILEYLRKAGLNTVSTKSQLGSLQNGNQIKLVKIP